MILGMEMVVMNPFEGLQLGRPAQPYPCPILAREGSRRTANQYRGGYRRVHPFPCQSM